VPRAPIARRDGHPGERLLKWAVETIAEHGRRFAVLTAWHLTRRCAATKRSGFRPLETVTLFAGMYIAHLFERELIESSTK